MPARVVLFDLDNTLVDRQRIFEEMLKQRLSSDYPDPQVLQGVVAEIMGYDNHGNLPRLQAFERYVAAHPEQRCTAAELNQYWEQHSGKKIYLFDDAEETMRYLGKRYRLGIVSNGAIASQRRKIEQLPFRDLLEFTVVSSELGYHKPDVRIFQYACDTMGVKPQECVFVGDNVRCDIEGALQAGMWPIWITAETAHRDPRVTCIRHLKELQTLL